MGTNLRNLQKSQDLILMEPMGLEGLDLFEVYKFIKKNAWNMSMVGMLVPLKGGIGSIFYPQTKARTISGI